MLISSRLCWLVAAACLGITVPAFGQIVESVGERAMGMGGAFVAVATDSSSTWWNPAAPAAGPFVDVVLSRAVTSAEDALPARRDQPFAFSLTTPPFGFAYYHLRLTQAAVPTAQEPANRQGEGAGVPYRSLSANQIGFTFVQSLLDGVHVGTTLKYLRGTLRPGVAEAGTSASVALDRAEDLSGGDSEGKFDLDIGVIAVGGPVRIGGVVRNVTEPEFRDGSGLSPFRLPRQVRVGAAYDASATGSVPVIVAVDADVRTYTVGTGDRRVVAVGAEQWFSSHRIGVRGGGRFNTVGMKERAATAGISVAVRSGLYVEGHAVGGGDRDEGGWGVGARVSF
jgi:hypothetical protein